MIGTIIKSILMEKGIKQNKLAEILGISCNSVSKKMNGKTEFKVKELMKIADFLNVDVRDFFEESQHVH